MPGLAPGIHDFKQEYVSRKVVDGRDELGHDGCGQCSKPVE